MFERLFKGIKSSLCPCSGRIWSHSADTQLHLITFHQSISISIVSIKGFQLHVQQARHGRGCVALNLIAIYALGYYCDVMWEMIIRGHESKDVLIFQYIKVTSSFHVFPSFCVCVWRRGGVIQVCDWYKSGKIWYSTHTRDEVFLLTLEDNST